MCPDKTAHGTSIDSQVIRSEGAGAPWQEVLTFPIKASGSDKPTLTATVKMWDAEWSEIAEPAGSRGRGQEVALFPARRKAAGDGATAAECGSASLASATLCLPSLYMEPACLNTVQLSMGTYRTLWCTCEENEDIVWVL